MSFIRKWLDKDYSDNITLQDVQVALIDKEIQEEMTLEYKGPDKILRPNELTDAISAFANSEGGLLVIGVSEFKDRDKRHIPERVKPITEQICTREWVEQTIVSQVHPNLVPAAKIKEIRESSGRLFLIDVPQSENAPIMASDNCYYFRKNYSSQKMEHYMVAIYFQRIHIPILRLRTFCKKPGIYSYDLSYEIVNVGENIAKLPFLSLTTINSHIEKSGRRENDISSMEYWDEAKELVDQSIAWDLSPKYIHSKMSLSEEGVQINLNNQIGAIVLQLCAENMAPKRFCSFIHAVHSPPATEKFRPGYSEMQLIPIMSRDDFDGFLQSARAVFQLYPAVGRKVKLFSLDRIRMLASEGFSREFENKWPVIESICASLLES